MCRYICPFIAECAVLFFLRLRSDNKTFFFDRFICKTEDVVDGTFTDIKQVAFCLRCSILNRRERVIRISEDNQK